MEILLGLQGCGDPGIAFFNHSVKEFGHIDTFFPLFWDKFWQCVMDIFEVLINSFIESNSDINILDNIMWQFFLIQCLISPLFNVSVCYVFLSCVIKIKNFRTSPCPFMNPSWNHSQRISGSVVPRAPSQKSLGWFVTLNCSPFFHGTNGQLPIWKFIEKSRFECYIVLLQGFLRLTQTNFSKAFLNNIA